MSYNKSLDFWFKCLNYVGMDPTKPKKYFGFLFIELSASFVALLALLDFFIQPDETDAFATLSVFVQVITKTLALFIHSNDYNQLTQELERFWRFETEEEFKNKVNKTLAWIYKGAVVCVVYLHVATFLFMLISVFSSRTMPFYSYVPKFLSRKFLYVFECSTFSTMALCAFCFDYINFIYLQLIIIQFKLLNAAISKLNIERGQNQSNFRPEMVKIIKHHIFLLDYIDRLNQIMSLPLFFQVFNSIPSLCFELYLLKTNDNFWYRALGTLHSGVVLIQLSIYCFSCQQVQDQGEEVAKRVYAIDWYELETNSLKKYIPIVIMRSQVPIQFSAAGFVFIDRPALVMVFQTSLTFYSFLVAMDTINQ